MTRVENVYSFIHVFSVQYFPFSDPSERWPTRENTCTRTQHEQMKENPSSVWQQIHAKQPNTLTCTKWLCWICFSWFVFFYLCIVSAFARSFSYIACVVLKGTSTSFTYDSVFAGLGEHYCIIWQRSKKKECCGSRGKLHVVLWIASSDVTQWLSRIVGNVGAGFRKRRRMRGIKRWYLWLCCIDFLSTVQC